MSEQIALTDYNNRKIELLPILLAQQLVLLPLYFFIPIWIAILNSLVVILVYLGNRKKDFIIPAWIKFSITLIAFFGILLSFHKVTGRDAGVALIAMMYGIKILEINSQRDVFVLMLLGFFLLLAGFLFDQSPIIAIYQFVAIAAILNALTSIHSLKPTAQIIQGSSASTLKQMLKYFVLAVPLMIVLFIFFPRLSGPIWKMPGGSSGSTGISETMTPGEISSLQLDEKVAFRVKFNGATPKTFEMYWRTLVLEQFDGLTWSRGIEATQKPIDDWKNKIAFSDKQEGKLNNRDATYRYDISLEKTRMSWLTLLDRPTNIPARSKIYSDYVVKANRRLTDRTRYKAESQPRLTLNLQLSESDRRLNTQLAGNGNQRSKNWAVQQRGKFGDDRAYIHSLLTHINRQPFFYTYTPPIMARDTVDSFWFDKRRGFCEHYASSLVFLARAADIPARVVVGYQGAEKNPLSDYWIVRYANAHAWTEIWFQNEGWVRIDPTAAIAPHRIEERSQVDYSQRQSLFGDFGFEAVDLDNIGWLKQFQFWMDRANTGWNDWVLDYSRDRQAKLFEGLGLEKLNIQQISIMMIAIISLILTVISFNWVKASTAKDPFQASFDRLMAKLAKEGVEIAADKGANELILELAAVDDTGKPLSKSRLCQDSIAELLEILNLYVLLRYQQKSTTNKQQKDFHRKVKALKIRSQTIS